MLVRNNPALKSSRITPMPTGKREQPIPSASLFGDARVILIEHADTIYQLRKTRNDKLILTK